MTVAVSLEDLLNSVAALREFASLEVPITLAFRIKKMLKRVQPDIDSANETLKALGEKHAAKDEKGAVVHPKDKDGNLITDQIKLKDAEAYKAERIELMKTEVKFGFEPLKPSELGDKITIKPGVLFALHWLFTDD